MALFERLFGKKKKKEEKQNTEMALEILMLVQEAMKCRDDSTKLTAVLEKIQQVANHEAGKYLPLLTAPQVVAKEEIEIKQEKHAAKTEVAFDVHEELSEDPVSSMHETLAAMIQNELKNQGYTLTKIQNQSKAEATPEAKVPEPPEVWEVPAAKVQERQKVQEIPAVKVQERPKVQEIPAAKVQEQPKVQENPVTKVLEELRAQEKLAVKVQEEPKIHENPVRKVLEELKAQEKSAVEVQERPKTQEKPAVKVQEQPKTQEAPAPKPQEPPKASKNIANEIPDISKTRTLNEIMASLPESVREVIAQSIRKSETPVEEPVTEKEPEPAPIQPERFAGKKVLYAFGNAEEYNFIQNTCAAWHIDLEMVANGLTAVKQFSASEPGTYDAIILEKSMPLMNGFMAAKCIRKDKHPESGSIPVIVAAVGTPVGQLEREGENISACLDAGTERELYDVFDAIWK